MERFRISFLQPYFFHDDFFQPQKYMKSEIVASTEILSALIIMDITIYPLELIFKSVNIWLLKILQGIEA